MSNTPSPVSNAVDINLLRNQVIALQDDIRIIRAQMSSITERLDVLGIALEHHTTIIHR